MKLNASDMAERRQRMLETAYRLFSENSIDAVTMGRIAAQTDYTLRSLHRYFNTKQALVVAVAIWAWENFTRGNQERIAPDEWERMTGAQQYTFFLDSFLDLYRRHTDLLCFNQMFNVYIRAAAVSAETLRPYQAMMDALRERFAAACEKGRRDGTLRTDMDEETMFSTTLHIMLAVVTRYAVGLVYRSESDPEQELLLQRDMLMDRFTTRNNSRNRT